MSQKETKTNISDLVVKTRRSEWLLSKIYNIPYYIRRISRAFLTFISILFFVGAVFASWIAVFKLNETILMAISLEAFDNSSTHASVPQFINLAEYFMVAVTFFAISIGLAFFSHPETKEEGVEKWADVSELEKYIFGMVIATISLAFLSGVLNTMSVISNITTDSISSATDIILKVGLGIGAVIISLGVYIVLSTKK